MKAVKNGLENSGQAFEADVKAITEVDDAESEDEDDGEEE